MGVFLLTGASGFVGYQVLTQLLKKNLKIHLVLRRGTEYAFANNPKIEKIILTEDIFKEDIDWWSDVCAGVETVIHCAWYAEHGKYLDSSKNYDCLAGTTSLAGGAILSGVKRFIGVGTCFEYDLEVVEKLRSDSAIKPLTIYAASKAATNLALSQIFRQAKVEFLWCRLFYLYGNGENPQRLYSYVKNKIQNNEFVDLTEGSQIRDYLDVEIAGKIIVEYALSDVVGDVNVCSGIPLSVKEFTENIAAEFGRVNLLRFGVRKNNLYDPPYVVGVKGK